MPSRTLFGETAAALIAGITASCVKGEIEKFGKFGSHKAYRLADLSVHVSVT